jgi:hypothetical protein
MSDLHHPDGTPLTDEEFRAEASHVWLNGFSCINPTAEFAEAVGRDVIRAVMESPLRTAPITEGSTAGMSRAAVLWFNAS